MKDDNSCFANITGGGGCQTVLQQARILEEQRDATLTLIAPDKPVEFFFEDPPTAADFLSFDFTGGYILEICWAGNLKINAGLLGVKYNVAITGVPAGICSPIIAIAAVRCFAAVLTPAMF